MAEGVFLAVAVVAVAMACGGCVPDSGQSSDISPIATEAKADSSARISLSPETVDLGRIGQSRSVAGTLTVWNTGTGDLVITDIETS